MFRSSIGLLRITAFLEGLSFVLLLFIAMPLKYVLGIPEVVRTIGMLHGLLFIAFIVLSIQVTVAMKWPYTRLVLLVVASVIPFGTFYADYRILRRA